MSLSLNAIKSFEAAVAPLFYIGAQFVASSRKTMDWGKVRLGMALE